MATESTPLRFVRCPSCRSLVPAVSQRCRMCGYSLNAEEGEETPPPSQASGRVRQRTMSQPNSELTEAAQRLRSEHMEEARTEPKAREAESVDGTLVTTGASSKSTQKAVSGDDLQDPLGDYLLGGDEDFGSKKKEASAGETHVNGNGTASHDEASLEPAEGKKVIIEQGQKRSGGLSFGRAHDPRKKREKSKHASDTKAKSEKTQETLRQEPSGGDTYVAQNKAIQEQDMQEVPYNSEDESRPAPQEMPQRSKQSRSSEASPEVSTRKGRLFGWMVSYADPDGEALELREGKFFVSSSSLKDTDLVIDHESVSTPHAIVTVSATKGLLVQDLMSERGVFVRGQEADTYRREEEIAPLDHGDWVRFGDVEFLVSLIAHVGEK